ncbi:hypothetical protein LRS12_09320 [Sphingomonas sp. J344]|nr:hypothetical protein [Sphingomonas sp. J344]MCR5870892.1 hypothetical protein [Sphingomonas sp. J344]
MRADAKIEDRRHRGDETLAVADLEIAIDAPSAERLAAKHDTTRRVAIDLANRAGKRRLPKEQLAAGPRRCRCRIGHPGHDRLSRACHGRSAGAGELHFCRSSAVHRDLAFDQNDPERIVRTAGREAGAERPHRLCAGFDDKGSGRVTLDREQSLAALEFDHALTVAEAHADPAVGVELHLCPIGKREREPFAAHRLMHFGLTERPPSRYAGHRHRYRSQAGD